VISLALIRYGAGTQIVEVAGSTKAGKLQLAARFSVTKAPAGIFVERKTTGARIDKREVVGEPDQDWRFRYVRAHVESPGHVKIPGFEGREISFHERQP
jgi:hypothetical protein